MVHRDRAWDRYIDVAVRSQVPRKKIKLAQGCRRRQTDYSRVYMVGRFIVLAALVFIIFPLIL